MDNIDHSPPLLEASELPDADEGKSVGAIVEQLERPSFGARVRMIVLLALLCWAVLIATGAWLIN